ncbi:hypothetical protein ABFS83_10G075600 [Erythranthe nasuta]
MKLQFDPPTKKATLQKPKKKKKKKKKKKNPRCRKIKNSYIMNRINATPEFVVISDKSTRINKLLSCRHHHPFEVPVRGAIKRRIFSSVIPMMTSAFRHYAGCFLTYNICV